VAVLVFHGGDGRAEIELDEPVEIRISGGTLSAGGPALAQHTGNAWHVGTQRIERIVCTGLVRVEFDGKAGRRLLGPFEEFSLADDAALTAQGIIARYQPLEQTWYFNRCDTRSEDPVGFLSGNYGLAGGG
jgi:hypothetical protein